MHTHIQTHFLAASHLMILPCPTLHRSPYPPPVCAPSPLFLPSFSQLVSPTLTHKTHKTHKHSRSPPLAAGLLLMLHRALAARCSPQLLKDLQRSRGKAFTLVSSGTETKQRCSCCCCWLLTGANWKPSDWWEACQCYLCENSVVEGFC